MPIQGHWNHFCTFSHEGYLSFAQKLHLASKKAVAVALGCRRAPTTDNQVLPTTDNQVLPTTDDQDLPTRQIIAINRVCTDFGKSWKIMEINNTIIQDLESFGKREVFQNGCLEKF